MHNAHDRSQFKAHYGNLYLTHIEFNDKVKEKEDIAEDFKTFVQDFKSYYATESKFCRQLESSYDEDLKVSVNFYFYSF